MIIILNFTRIQVKEKEEMWKYVDYLIINETNRKHHLSEVIVEKELEKIHDKYINIGIILVIKKCRATCYLNGKFYKQNIFYKQDENDMLAYDTFLVISPLGKKGRW